MTGSSPASPSVRETVLPSQPPMSTEAVEVVAGGGWHDAVYRAAAEHDSLHHIPWADGVPNPHVVHWLNTDAQSRVRPGSRAVVVGCGLGDDVVELASRGYDAVGFDLSPTAIDWARRRFPEHASRFFTADLFALPGKHRHRYEMVVEVYTLQSIHPATRSEAMGAISMLAGPRGVIVVVARRDDAPAAPHLAQAAAPPWPLSMAELTALTEAAGLRPRRPIEVFDDAQPIPVPRLRGIFERE